MKLLIVRCSEALVDIWTEISFFAKHQFFFLYSVVIYSFLKRKQPLKLHLGSGRIHIEDWVNIDIMKYPEVDVCVDLRRGFPFKRNSVTSIYAEHTFEHFSPTELNSIFYQCHRVLKSDAPLYFNIPNFELLTRSFLLKENKTLSYLKKDLKRFNVTFDGQPKTLQDNYYFDHVLHQLGEHKFYYTFPLLKNMLKAVGFRKIKQTFYMPYQNMSNIKARKAYSLFVEAVK